MVYLILEGPSVHPAERNFSPRILWSNIIRLSKLRLHLGTVSQCSCVVRWFSQFDARVLHLPRNSSRFRSRIVYWFPKCPLRSFRPRRYFNIGSQGCVWCTRPPMSRLPCGHLRCTISCVCITRFPRRLTQPPMLRRFRRSPPRLFRPFRLLPRARIMPSRAISVTSLTSAPFFVSVTCVFAIPMISAGVRSPIPLLTER